MLAFSQMADALLKRCQHIRWMFAASNAFATNVALPRGSRDPDPRHSRQLIGMQVAPWQFIWLRLAQRVGRWRALAGYVAELVRHPVVRMPHRLHDWRSRKTGVLPEAVRIRRATVVAYRGASRMIQNRDPRRPW
jgi:hypothetical protein